MRDPGRAISMFGDDYLGSTPVGR
ncbi:MAG: hypothetical protein QOG44_190, partial [Acidimicrobiaceae bacterium]|nr:hypothetical protein [Acidimicrobiaceae bacterium]